ncbi:MAG: hypothetical protein A2X94_16595 [Bdellovibrionales bacterium GWB1_55_8]|nr:MAG: hypothetical protein A2X94_16595 [Bdellovibrionales bacterium GWB1_55_8]
MGPLLAAFLFLVQAISPVSQAAQSRVPVIISFGGTGTAQIKQGALEREAQVGSKVEYGSIIQTGPETTVTVQYPDGSLVAIDAETRFEIQERRGGVQSNALHVGQARGSIIKLKTGAVLKKPRFMIRTRAAIMGVRGTEFVIAVDPSGLSTQVHTLEGLVDVAADESALLSGGGVSIPSGQFIEATESGLSSAQPFDRSGFEQSLKPPIAGGPAQMAFTAPGGATVLKKSVPLPSAAPALLDSTAPLDTRREPEDPPKEIPQRGLQTPAADQPEKPAKTPEKNRPIRLLSFQGAFFFMSPTKDGNRKNGTGELIRAAALSWDPELPIPLLPFLSVRGHAGVVLARDGSLYNRFLMREFQAFGTLKLLDRFFAEVGVGHVAWPRREFSAGLVSMNVGFLGGAGGAFSRMFIGRTETITQAPEETFRLGFGISF